MQLNMSLFNENDIFLLEINAQWFVILPLNYDSFQQVKIKEDYVNRPK
jgi:hypothetical protein